MPEITNKVLGAVIVLIFGALSAFSGWLWTSVSKHNETLTSHETKIITIEDKMKEMDKDFDKLGDVYVTRRELNIILENIDTKLSNVSMNVNNMQVSTQSINDKLDKLTEKLYQK